jgi:hypothetical protein
MQEILFKNDRYKKNRGGHSRWLLLNCEKCKNRIAIYQKDGPGILKRLYLDRMVDIKDLSGKNLVCKKCKAILGTKIIYKKENRSAYRLFVGAVEKKTISRSHLSFN